MRPKYGIQILKDHFIKQKKYKIFFCDIQDLISKLSFYAPETIIRNVKIMFYIDLKFIKSKNYSVIYRLCTLANECYDIFDFFALSEIKFRINIKEVLLKEKLL